MKRKVEFPLEDGSTVIVNVDEPETGGTVRAARGVDIVEKSKYSFEDAVSKIYSITEKTIKNAIAPMRHLSLEPSEIEIEIGFDLSPEFGAAIARSSTEANCKVTLRWRPQEEL